MLERSTGGGRGRAAKSRGFELEPTLRTVVTTACAVGDCTNEVQQGFGALENAGEYGIQGYQELQSALKGTGLFSHHILPARFATNLGVDPETMGSAAVTAAEHNPISTAWHDAIPYINSGGALTTETATETDIWNAASKVYSEIPIFEAYVQHTLFSLGSWNW